MVKLNENFRPSNWSDEDWYTFQNKGEVPIRQGKYISMEERQAQRHRNEVVASICIPTLVEYTGDILQPQRIDPVSYHFDQVDNERLTIDLPDSWGTLSTTEDFVREQQAVQDLVLWSNAHYNWFDEDDNQ